MSTVAGRSDPTAITPIVGAGATGRRRRPSGEPPPLPHHVPISAFLHLAALLLVVGFEVAMAFTTFRRWITRIDDLVLDAVTSVRSGALTSMLRAVADVGSANAVRVIGWSTIAVLLLSRRFRHLLTYLAVLLVVVTATSSIAFALGRMRPTSATMLVSWRGYSHPSASVAIFAAVVAGAVYTLVPSGRWRRPIGLVGGALVVIVGVSRVYLGVDHPTDVLAALAIGWAFSVVVYRIVVPEEVFGVRYRRHGNPAHLDLSGARGPAIRSALQQQLGIAAESIEPYGLEASAGSTPLRIRTRDGRALFGKLYAVSHLRSDRSYKLARMVLYGRLEDEKPFATVRRLVEYEDHMLRLLRDNGLPVPAPHGFVEITPEREYVIVMDFVEHARDLGAAPLGQQEIDEGLRIVRKLWQAGVAHRDVKPSNLLVKEGRVHLIDVAFATVRPTPWRQAVDLSNMMLTLALASDAQTVYERAVRQFAPDDIAEAFAACRSITIPTQLRTRLRADSRDLIGEFRLLAPRRATVHIQVWSVRRLGVLTAVLAGIALAGATVYYYAQVAGLL
jgi:membrane-associated phospholipid phosphatase/tRNA A-37 threonylcarbamoyl transferase component Bud32